MRRMCRVLDVSVSVSGYNAHLQPPESWCAIIDDVLIVPLRVAFAASGET